MQRANSEDTSRDEPVMLSDSKKSRVRAWKWILLSVSILAGYALFRNYAYLSGGLLNPDFGLIHKAYDFNFWELPLTLLGVVVAFSALGLVWASVRRGLILVSLIYGFIAVDLFIFRYYITYVEPQKMVVHHVRLHTSKLSEPVRLLHISDIQSGGISKYELRLFERIKELRPDLILNTGDFLQTVPPATFESEFPKLLELIKAANPRFGTYAVFGDTERELYNVLPEAIKPLRMLSSCSTRIDTGSGTLNIYGLSLYQSRNPVWAQRAVDEWLTMPESDDFFVLMGHAPDLH